MTDYSERIPAAIADGERLLDAGEYVLIPPHIGGNDTKLTLVLTAGEVAAMRALWENPPQQHAQDATGSCNWCQALRAFTEKMEGLSND